MEEKKERLSFDEFHSMRNRRRRAQEQDTAAQTSEVSATTLGNQKGQTKRQSFHERVGSLVEKHEVQMATIALIGADIVSVTMLIFLETGYLDVGALREPTLQVLRSLTGFTIFVFLVEIGMVVFAFGEKSLTHMGYLLDLCIVLSSVYWEVSTGNQSKRTLEVAAALMH